MMQLFKKLLQTSRLKNMYECTMDALRSYILKYGGAMTAFSMLIPASYVNEGEASFEDGTGEYFKRRRASIAYMEAL